jgi:aminocarboxymuconate-semialdehyde decarboxylase
MTRGISIDVHAHLLPRETMRLLAKESPRVAPVLIEQGDGSLDMTIAGRLVQRPMPRQMFELDLRLADMDANDVDMQLVCTAVQTFFYHEDAALGAACAALQNDELAAVVRRHPARLKGLATLPMQDPPRAADELRRAVRTLGLCGAQIGSNVNGGNLDEPALDPVWAAADELRAFVLVHPHGEVVPGDRLKSYYMRNFVGLPFETTVAGASLVFGGVLERHPNMTVCLCHGGGFVPYQLGRFLHGHAVRTEPKLRLREGPEASLARLHYDSIVHSARALEFLIDQAGPERVLLGSDYPFDMGNLDCVARVEAVDRPRAVKDAVLGGRAGAVLERVARG